MNRMAWLTFLEVISADDVGRTVIVTEAAYLLRLPLARMPVKYRASLVKRGLSTTALDAVLAAWRAAGGKPRKVKRRRKAARRRQDTTS